MQSAVLQKLKEIDVQEQSIQVPADNEVLIKVKAVGLCGSDIHYYEHGKIGDFIVEKPIILGHEVSGEIIDLGKGVQDFEKGQRVAIEPGKTCGTCVHCQSGRYNLCKEVEFLATPPYDGAFCQYIVMRSDLVFPIPDGMSDETGALIEPFSVGLHACSRGDVKDGDTVLILGMGPIGLLTAAAAKMSGAGLIIGVDLEQARLDKAKELGADEVINVKTESFEEKISEYTNGLGVDVAIETAGSPAALKNMISAVRRGGKAVIVGMSSEDEASLNIAQIINKEIDIRGVFRYHHTYPKAIQLLSESKIDIEKIITDYYDSLHDVEAAFEKAIQDKKNTLKIMIYPNGR
ncbi:NAD(P)-dependent alcohol dehydrogenase [Domibacillus sp. DTU_2020_1001157_1_SI_ALB_TIR_016]|uniref:NAD(P)-dependent alcohol dehydrogenase n=1 Tax=Domibacillus sp. DTU_2020_1001157_1_SI_ALB_TIR_016 TaxID=3077789 RepID=UPI0028F0BCA8|nr:NAD(P)-dependent alcohol dehydrogenase [Domibacillus sp. DTU_2020_1001157_1_SI_ALB_TIR_016]WNS78992.1 NAD(P)-dependent alcohol dehydrogenase [Domibacillus sp. DTU_2020_1001157_1_SI_ALB_TIR_016]